MLPYFQKTGYFFDAKADIQEPRFDGPFYITSVSKSDPKRQYRLRGPIKEAYPWGEIRVQYDPDGCSGNIYGVDGFLKA